MFKDNHNSLVTMIIVALIAAITCILAPLAIPIPVSPVPISLTNLVIYVSAYIIAKYCAGSYVLYLLLGLVGLPVFSGFAGGAGKLFGPTGGYLIGFIPLAIIAGLAVEFFPKKIWIHAIAFVLGTLICYGFGTAWLAYQAHMTFKKALWAGVIPYIAGDTAKIVISLIVGPYIRKQLIKAGVLK